MVQDEPKPELLKKFKNIYLQQIMPHKRLHAHSQKREQQKVA